MGMGPGGNGGNFTRPRSTKIRFVVSGARTSKQVGEFFEAAFLTKAASLGFGVSKPWGESQRYDFIVDNGKQRWRVQVKATITKHCQSYVVNTRHFWRKRPTEYTNKEIDFLVAYVAPLDRWYVIPVEALKGRYYIRIFPKENKRARFEQYREAWHLLRAQPDERPLGK
jgi:PD-(D/E)XK nuclease superfamily protein